MGFGECPKCWDYYCDCTIDIYVPPVRPIEKVKEVDMNKKEVMAKRKPKHYVSTYGDKVFTSLSDLMKYESEMEAKMEAEENRKPNIPYKE